MVLFKQRASASAKASDDSGQPSVVVEEGGRVALAGDWTTVSVASVDRQMRDLEDGSGPLAINLAGVRRLDTAGAWLIHRLASLLTENGRQVTIEGESPTQRILLDAVRETVSDREKPARLTLYGYALRTLENIGRGVFRMIDDLKLAMHILGATIRGAQMKLGRGHGVNPAAIVTQIDRMGIGAIPVVLLMSAIVGAIVAQQGAFQLRYFGAEIFVVDLVGILVLREMGVLLTAIMVAGRTGSAITAEIGSMKMREEIDALTVIGLNPVGVLVFPRLVALVIALPCLTVLANFAALGGAMAVGFYYSDIPPAQFIDRLRSSVDLSTIAAGLIKAPFMALIVGIIASVEGMKVEGSAESLGRRVTASVVKSIFVVIVVDGLFAMFYAAVNF